MPGRAAVPRRPGRPPTPRLEHFVHAGRGARVGAPPRRTTWRGLTRRPGPFHPPTPRSPRRLTRTKSAPPLLPFCILGSRPAVRPRRRPADEAAPEAGRLRRGSTGQRGPGARPVAHRLRAARHHTAGISASARLLPADVRVGGTSAPHRLHLPAALARAPLAPARQLRRQGPAGGGSPLLRRRRRRRAWCRAAGRRQRHHPRPPRRGDRADPHRHGVRERRHLRLLPRPAGGPARRQLRRRGRRAGRPGGLRRRAQRRPGQGAGALRPRRVTISPAGTSDKVFDRTLWLRPLTVYTATAVGTPSNGTFEVLLTTLRMSRFPQRVAPARVTVVHGINGKDLGLAEALPVDVQVGSTCLLPGFTFRTIAGPVKLAARPLRRGRAPGGRPALLRRRRHLRARRGHRGGRRPDHRGAPRCRRHAHADRHRLRERREPDGRQGPGDGSAHRQLRGRGRAGRRRRGLPRRDQRPAGHGRPAAGHLPRGHRPGRRPHAGARGTAPPPPLAALHRLRRRHARPRHLRGHRGPAHALALRAQLLSPARRRPARRRGPPARARGSAR
ncbi:MAG: hypothetical protein M0C28_40785 [Candidatus Moduliflexus flocculans]|nr:hypothetical protein [Candidatus Moduliflexus flocculans]